MKILAACFLAIALVLRAAPICAAPVQTEAVAMMADCEGVPDHHDGKSGQKGDDAARSCHACAFPVATADLTQPLRVIAVQNLLASAQLAGGALKPPTPPPRRRGAHFFQSIIGVKS
jgi:hypothetical protein